MIVYLARNKDGDLYLHGSRPSSMKNGVYCTNTYSVYISEPAGGGDFSEVVFENSPQPYRLVPVREASNIEEPKVIFRQTFDKGLDIVKRNKEELEIDLNKILKLVYNNDIDLAISEIVNKFNKLVNTLD